MHRFQQSTVSPIKLLKSSKDYQTPLKLQNSLQKSNQIELFKQKSFRLQKQNKQLKDQLRILQTQNRQLNTQIQIYRDGSKSTRGYKNQKNTIQNQRKISHQIDHNNKKIQSQQVQRLLKQIRVLKNNHELQLSNLKDMIKKNKKHMNQLEIELLTQKNPLKSKQQSNPSYSHPSPQSLQSKQLKKSIIQYMQQKDNQIQKNKKLQSQIQRLKEQLKQLRIKYEKQLDEKVDRENQIRRNDNMNKINQKNKNDDLNINFEKYERLPLVIDNLYGQQQKYLNNGQTNRKLFNIDYKRQLFYQSSNGKRQQQKNNNNQHNQLPMDHIIQINQSLHYQISNLTSKLQTQQLFHQNQLKNLEFTVQRYKKQLQQKQQDLVRVLVKLKPLLLEKHKLTSRQNNDQQENKRNKENKINKKEEQQRENIAKNSYGLKMLEVFLEKYKVEAYSSNKENQRN